MKQILWQMQVADQVENTDTSSLVRLHMKDSVTKIYQQILKDNKTTLADYKKSLAYYQSKPALMKLLIDTTLDYGNKIKDSFVAHYKPKQIIKKIDSTKKTKIDSLHSIPKLSSYKHLPFSTKFQKAQIK